MYSIEILGNGYCLPKHKIENEELNTTFSIDSNWIYKRTGIQSRYYIEKEKIEDLAIGSVKNLLEHTSFSIKDLGIIIVATTSTSKLMPGISFAVQKYFSIDNCLCLDILAGCSGYINAFDIVRKYIALGEVKYGLVIGAEVLSKYLDQKDINTAVLLGDGAGATLIGRTNNNKKYAAFIESDWKDNEILTCANDKKIFMDGKKIYKFGTTRTVENIKQLLKITGEKLDDIAYIIPHQSNQRMLESMCNKLNISIEKMYINLERVGNTFCASIPIALTEMYERKLLNEKDKVIFLGYGGGLNLGSILCEI